MARNVTLRQEEESPRRTGGAIDYGVLTELVGFWVRRAEVRALQSFHQHLARWEVSPTEVATLIIVESNPGLSQIELAGALNTDQSTVVSPLDRLEKRGLIRRTRLARDRRYQVLHLTKTGSATVREIKKALAEHHGHLTEGFSDQERRTLMDLLRRFAQG